MYLLFFFKKKLPYKKKKTEKKTKNSYFSFRQVLQNLFSGGHRLIADTEGE